MKMKISTKLQRGWEYFYFMFPYNLMSPCEQALFSFVLSSILFFIGYSTYKSFSNIHALAEHLQVYSVLYTSMSSFLHLSSRMESLPVWQESVSNVSESIAAELIM